MRWFALSELSRGTRAAAVETLEPRRLLAFANWSAIGPAIAKVPTSAGQLASVSVVNFGTTVYTGPLNVANTLNRIRADKGPDRTDDGIVYTNPGASGLPSDGTYYEFTVEPSGGTDHTFTFSSPGPMRVLLATGGDCFFTGDHYSTFKAVYIYGSAAVPTIGSFAPAPASVTAGASLTLTASNVTETGGTIANVKFYRETNGTTGLQIGADSLVGTGTASGTTYALSTATTGFAAGSYTYYAVATDAASAVSATASTTVTVTATTPPPSGELLGWDVNGQTAYGIQGLGANTVATGVANSTGLTRGAGVTALNTASANAWGGTGWSQTTGAAGAAAGQTVTFGLTVATGYAASLSAVDLAYRHSGTGPTGGYWQYDLNGGAWTLIADVAGEFPSSTGTMAELNLSGIAALQNLPAGTAVALRLSPYAATSTGGNWYVTDGNTGDDLTVSGTVAVAAAPLVLAGPADYLKLDADGLRVDVWNNTTGTGTPAKQLPLSQVTAMSYAGTASADSLTVDFSAGNPLVAGGLTYDGGTGGADALAVIGTAGNDTVTVGTTTMAVSAAFGSATISYARATALAVSGGSGGSDTLLQSAQPGNGATLAFAATANDTLTVTGGTFAFPAPAAGAGAVGLPLGTLAVVGAGRAVVPSAAAAADLTVFDVGEVDFAGGTLDLGRNAMVVQYDDLPTVTAAVATAYAAGAWTGTGLTSATAAADAAHLSAVGVAAATVDGTFLGQPVVAGDVLVRTTIVGDTNLDSVVTAADYTRIDAGFVLQLTGWANGDFNYDGTVDGSDYTLIDNAFNRQAAPAAVVAVTTTTTTTTARPAVAAAAPSSVAWWTTVDLRGRKVKGEPPFAGERDR